LNTLGLSILGQSVQVECPDPEARGLLTQKFGPMVAADPVSTSPTHLNYVVRREQGTDRFSFWRTDGPLLSTQGIGGFLYSFEKDLTIELQRLRQDLYFLHAAALQHNGGAVVLVGESKSGKSTMSWALTHHGFRYLSDELSPIDLQTMTVIPFPASFRSTL